MHNYIFVETYNLLNYYVTSIYFQSEGLIEKLGIEDSNKTGEKRLYIDTLIYI
jgi:hypothetical protein